MWEHDWQKTDLCGTRALNSFAEFLKEDRLKNSAAETHAKYLSRGPEQIGNYGDLVKDKRHCKSNSLPVATGISSLVTPAIIACGSLAGKTVYCEATNDERASNETSHAESLRDDI